MPHRSPSRSADVSAVILFPNKREIACASLGFLKTFEALRSRTRVADLSYVPTGRDDPILSARKGLLLGEMSRLEVARFDLIGFSLSYENDFVNVPALLKQAGLPPLARNRTDALPLVVCGGFTMSTNPLPIADFVDAAVVGEIEPVADSLVGGLEYGKARGLSKDRLIDQLAGLEGVYVPSLGERPVRRIWSSAEDIVSEPGHRLHSYFGDMFLVETGRGCGRGCHFCAAGNLYRPVRVRKRGTILNSAGDAPRIGLLGTAVGDHPDLREILERITADGRKVGISSLRPDQVTPEIAALLVRGGVKTIAIAPEAGTEELRARIGKPLDDQTVSKAVGILSSAGIMKVKLYFMIGLPGETDADVRALVHLVTRLAAVRGRTRLTVAAGPFVPKPQTVFQWAPFCDNATLKKRVKILKAISRMKGCSLKIQPLGEAWVEAVLSRGDRSLSGPLLEAAAGEEPLKRVLLRSSVWDPTVELDTEEPLPWDFIDSGVDRKRLRRQYLESKPV